MKKIVNGTLVDLTSEEEGRVLAEREKASQAREVERVAALPAGVNAERKRRLAQGLDVTLADGRTFRIQTDPESREIIAGLASLGQIRTLSGDGTITVFRDADNVDQDLAPADAIAMGLQLAAWVDSVFKASWALKGRADLASLDIADDTHWSV